MFRLWIKQKIPSRKVTHLPIIRRKSKLSSLYCYFDCCVTTFGNCRNAKMYLSVNDTWECYLNSHTVSNKIFLFDNLTPIYLRNLFDQYFHFTHCIQIWNSCPHTWIIDETKDKINMKCKRHNYYLNWGNDKIIHLQFSSICTHNQSTTCVEKGQKGKRSDVLLLSFP